MKMKLKGRISKNNVNISLLPITRKVFRSIRYKNVYYVFSEVKMKISQSYPTLCNPVDCSPEEGNGTPLQYSCLENPMDRGAWCAAVHGVSKSRARLSASLSLFTFMHWRRKWQPTPVFLPGESQGRGSLVGCRLWGHTELDMTEAT